ncbi:galactose mutarotase-like protein [Pholiota conissans]|uniref:Galactose mutarotase-like protein n=1 Tax=Pholiota conissans TaxID=109636 RepID=A0A9P6CUE5_9AGAR|nr:galactose mutarotase-like protein [Pholiota conissans]
MAEISNNWPFDLTEITAPDGSITAKFVSFGATLTELWVKDKDGKLRDVVLGYDDNSRLETDPDHPVFNAIVGRYANRIKDGLFSIPITKHPDPTASNTYHIPTNDANGQVTLHGGIRGWDRRSWTLVEKTSTSVTYKHVDNADEGFPGTVTAFVIHSVSDGGVLRTKLHATATEKTPIMLTQHIYWNLDAFQNGVQDSLEHNLWVDASRYIEVNDLAIPTGNLPDVSGTPLDFRKEQKIGARWDQTVDLCGKGCIGYNAGWVLDQPQGERAVVSLSSDVSGIRLDITTNQPVIIVYSSFWLNTDRKEIHGGPNLKYGSSSAVAIEQQGYIAAINTPEWDVDQIYQPGREYEWSSEYKFSAV